MVLLLVLATMVFAMNCTMCKVLKPTCRGMGVQCAGHKLILILSNNDKTMLCTMCSSLLIIHVVLTMFCNQLTAMVCAMCCKCQLVLWYVQDAVAG